MAGRDGTKRKHILRQEHNRTNYRYVGVVLRKPFSTTFRPRIFLKPVGIDQLVPKEPLSVTNIFKIDKLPELRMVRHHSKKGNVSLTPNNIDEFYTFSGLVDLPDSYAVMSRSVTKPMFVLCMPVLLVEKMKHVCDVLRLRSNCRRTQSFWTHFLVFQKFSWRCFITVRSDAEERVAKDI